MSQISLEIGRQIRLVRKKNMMRISDLAKAINKSIGTVSKYEKGEIVIDIETLYDIADALNVSPERLLFRRAGATHHPSACGIPNFFSGISQFYSYIYDGRSASIVPCVFDIMEEDDDGSYIIMMYMNYSSLHNYQHCENTYHGRLRHFDAMTYISLINKDTPMEEASVQILASYLDSDTKYGLFNGFSSRPMMPIAVKMLFSKIPLEQNEELKSQLKVSRADVQMLKLYNMLCVV